jgi:CopG family nickel-responsive transcriptional regulator
LPIRRKKSYAFEEFTLRGEILSELARFGVSIDQDLLENYDRLVAERGYATRSEALRDLIREALIQQKIEMHAGVRALGSLTLVYDHQARNLVQEMGEIQHDFHENILSVMHLHVSHADCLEIIALSGVVSKIAELANRLLSLKGIKNGKLFLTLPSSTITEK